ncbi:hypothetical protein C809_00691 [Lachnospiraceae bacterium MD335]|jgi:uncharacterized membrane protein YsdA (DUF1294 family)|nr:hypothetical protein C809_00691 [Lachnospiraceae bacterium MD335]
MVVISIIAGYLALMNLIGFAMMGIDKHKAVKKLWRIPEYTFFVIALIGGSVGSIIGMRVFHHKTRHWYFVYGMPFILILQVALVVCIAKSPLQFSIM